VRSALLVSITALAACLSACFAAAGMRVALVIGLWPLASGLFVGWFLAFAVAWTGTRSTTLIVGAAMLAACLWLPLRFAGEAWLHVRTEVHAIADSGLVGEIDSGEAKGDAEQAVDAFLAAETGAHGTRGMARILLGAVLPVAGGLSGRRVIPVPPVVVLVCIGLEAAAVALVAGRAGTRARDAMARCVEAA